MRVKRCYLLLLIGVAFADLTIGPTVSAAQESRESGSAHQIDVDDLIIETQKSVRGKEFGGIVWWIPPVFWEASGKRNDADVKEMVTAMRQYTTVAVAVGKLGAFGSITWVAATDVRSKTRLQDDQGEEYLPLDNVSPAAQMLATVLKPMLASAIGKMGESLELLFFPAVGKSGKPLADPRSKGTFSVVIRDIAGPGDSVYQWRLPLTSLSPPRFCPEGNERVKADWNYCPWHGTRLQTQESTPQGQQNK